MIKDINLWYKTIIWYELETVLWKPVLNSCYGLLGKSAIYIGGSKNQ